MTAVKRVAVIGGGLAGLSAAHRLLELANADQSPLQVSLFEGSKILGGLVQTQTIQGYLVELGADSFITNKPAAVKLCERLGLQGELIPTVSQFRRSQVLFRGKLYPVPEGFQLLAPSSLTSILSSPLFSWRGKLRMACEPLISARKETTDESLAAFVRRRLGREALERLVQPMVGGIYTSDPEKLSLAATLSRFQEMERQDGSLLRGMARRSNAEASQSGSSGARYGLFATLKGGLSSLVHRLVTVLEQEGVPLQTNARVTRLSRVSAAEGYQLELSDGWRGTFDAIVYAIPAKHATSLLSELAPELTQLLSRIPYASSAIVVSGHSLSEIQDPLDAFGLVVPAVERRKILAVSYASRKFPGRAPEGKVLLRTFVGGAMQPELFDLPDAELQQLVSEELRQILGVRGKSDFTRVVRYPQAMPQFHVGHVELVQQIRAAAAQLPRCALAGNAYDGVGVPDTIASGEQAAEQIYRELHGSA